MLVNMKITTFTFLLLCLFCLTGRAAANRHFFRPNSHPSISEFLNPDGTINLYTGFSGSLNITGFSVQLDPEKGIVASPAADQEAMTTGTWWPVGAGLSTGSNHNCYAIAISGNNLYAGGFFTAAGGTPVNNIAKWDGNTWSALGTGLNASCRALAILGSDLYAAGQFITAGGIPAGLIAKWDGNTWSAVHTGLSGGTFCYALAVSGSTLYAGGNFTSAGGVPASRVAKWDGSNWSALGNGLSGGNNVCNALAVSETGDLYAGGNFTLAGTVSANHIAKWNGTAWSALGTGFNTYCQAISISGTDVYAGGNFDMAGGVSVNKIAKWDGSNWSALGTGLTGSFMPQPYCYTMVISGTDLYIGGGFNAASGVAANRIARWDAAAPLPVELTDFSGRIRDESVQLNWQTASETNNKGFDVERSADGWDWTRLGFVPALGEGNGLANYNFTDAYPLTGQNYYRLKQWDHGGQYEYSTVIGLNITGTEKQTGPFYPNPAHAGLVTLDYFAEKEGELTVTVFDASGRLIIRQNQSLDENHNLLQFDFSELTTGTYSILLNDGTNRTYRTLSIQ